MHRKERPVRRVLQSLALCAGLVFVGQAAAQSELSDEDAQNRAIAREQARVVQMQADAAARAAMENFRIRVAEADRQLTSLQEARAGFDRRKQALLGDDTGRRIAVQNHRAGLVIMDWIDWPLFRDTEMTERRRFIDEMKGFLEARQSRPDVPYTVNPEHAEKTDDVYLWARGRSARLAERLAWIDDAVRSVDEQQPVEGVATLAEVIESFRKARRDLWATAAAAGVERAREEAEPQMTEAARVAELERLLLETEQRLIEARQRLAEDRSEFESAIRRRQAEAAAAATEAETARKNLLAETERTRMLEDANRKLRIALSEAEARNIQDDARRVELTQRAQSPAVRRDLAPVLAPGTWQPGLRNPNPAGPVQPMSYDALLKSGALEQSETGLRILMAIVNARGCSGAHGIQVMQGQGNRRRHLDSMRPKLGFPSRFRDLTTAQIDQLRQMQEALIELGPTLVELEMLAP